MVAGPVDNNSNPLRAGATGFVEGLRVQLMHARRGVVPGESVGSWSIEPGKECLAIEQSQARDSPIRVIGIELDGDVCGKGKLLAWERADPLDEGRTIQRKDRHIDRH